MKFTSEDLMKAMGLKVGDRIEITDNHIVGNKIFTIKQLESLYIGNADYCFGISFLLDTNFKILPTPKRVGDLLCTREINCDVCPIKLLCKGDIIDVALVDKLYNVLEKFKESEYFDQEVYYLLKARLDKEVKDNV